ncbi:undecaprenyl-diphosphatase UppP [Candidatus Parcubacteria bacterium]|nr:undecaprenyl-diphosphatase UppP [Candidatus Parcubacteria bacterium]
MLTYLHATILGIVEGLTEFVPISSSGHLILARDIFHINSGDALSVDAVLQMGAILAVLVYFFGDLWHLLNAAFRWVSRKIVSEEDKKMILAVILGTIPGVILGFLLEKKMDTVFRSVHLVAWTLIAGSVLMFFAERIAKQSKAINTVRGFIIGLFQALALVPGVSRSGATISGGLITGLTREEATRFSFILSFPIILGAGLKKFLDLYHSGSIALQGLPLSLGFVITFITALGSIHFLINYLRKHSLDLFIWYRVVLAILILILL